MYLQKVEKRRQNFLSSKRTKNVAVQKTFTPLGERKGASGGNWFPPGNALA